MLSKLYYLFIGLIGLACFSCNPESQLASDVTGAWNGNARHIDVPGSINTTAMDTYSFERDGDTAGGTVTVATLITSQTALPQTDTTEQQLTATVTGTVSMTGTWSVTDDDEIAITLNPNTTMTTVNPDGIVLNENILTQTDSASVQAFNATLIASVKPVMTAIGTKLLLEIDKLDDVKVHNQTMTFELHHRDVTLRQQGANS